MRFLSINLKLILLLFVLISTSILVYAASTITNPLCSLQQVTNFPQNFFETTAISGDGSRAAVGHADYYEIWNLSNNSRVTVLDNAEFPVLDYDGSRIAFVSTGNMTGQNADGSYELFLWNNGTFTQLTSLTGENTSIGLPDISDDGTKVVFAVDPVMAPSAEGSFETKYYIWREGSGVSSLFDGASQPVTTTWAYTPIRISADGNTAIFIHDGQLSAGAPEGGGAYRINLTTNAISYLFGRNDYESTFEFMFIDGDANRIAFSSTENFSGLNPSSSLVVWVWDESDGFRMLSNGSGSAIYPYVYVMGFSADGNRVLFASGFNPTGENPDGNVEFYIHEYSNNSIRQISSRTGFPYPFFGFEALSANGQRAAIMLPTGIDYDPEDYNYFHNSELFEANCTESRPSPNNLRTTSVSQTSISLAWNDNAMNESQYRLERSVNGTNWTQIASLNANTTSYSDTGLSCSSSYFYRVRAYWSTGVSYSEYSQTLGLTTSSCPSSPNAPDNLHTTDISPTTIDLAWDDNASDETAFYVERSTNNGVDWTQVASLAANATSYSDTVQCNKTYHYRVRVTRSGSGGYVAYSEAISATSGACPPPIAPSNLQVLAVGKTSAALSWTDNSSDETGFQVERSNNGGTSWTLVSIRAANSTSYTISLTCETEYQFRVRANNSTNAVNSEYSNVVSATTTACIVPPASPTNLVAGTITRNSIQLNWTDNATDETFYFVERSFNNGVSWSQVANLSANVTTLNNTSLICGASYQYRVRAYRSSNPMYSDYSNVLTVSTLDCLPPPSTPENFQVLVIDETSVQLSWNLTADITSYYLERSTDGGTNWTALASPTANITSYTHIAECNTSYHYRMRSYRSGEGFSPYTDILSGTTPVCTTLLAPSNFHVTSVTSTSISLGWDNSPNETYYYVERSLDNGTNWEQIATLWANNLTYTNTGLNCGTNYQYRIRAMRGGIESDYSEAITGTAGACPFAPTNLRVSAFSITSITLAWDDTNTDETNYRVERSLDAGASWTQIISLGASSVSYPNTGLSCDTSYQYRVRAYRSAGAQYSPYSNIISGTTGNCPHTPTNLQLTESSLSTIRVSWTDTNSDETSYRLEVSLDGVNNWSSSTLSANTSSYTYSDLDCETTLFFRVRAYRSTDNKYSDYSNIISASTTACPLAPTNLQVTSIEPRHIGLNWEDNANDETHYIVEYHEPGENWEASYYNANVTSVRHGWLSCGKDYEFRVRAYIYINGNAEHFSDYSNTVTASTSDCPLAPTNFVVASFDQNNITLTWDDNATNETSYLIEFNNGGSGGAVSASANATSYTHTNRKCNTTYQYYIRATNPNIGYSDYAPAIEVTTAPCLELTAPTNLRTTSVTANRIIFAWDDSNADENSFSVERSLDNGVTWTFLSNSFNLSLNNSGLICNSTYQYRVRASRSTDSAYSPYSDVLTVTTAACVPLATPTNLDIVSNTHSSIKVEWTDSNADETNFQLEVTSYNGTNWTLVATTTASPYTHTGLSCNTIYQYRVRAYRAVDNSFSAYSTVLVTGTVPCPNAPSYLRVDSGTATSLTLLWNDNSNDETNFYVEKSTDGGASWTQIATRTANSTSYTDSGLSCGTYYKYRVRAYRSNTNVYSNYSNILTTSPACPLPPLAAPSNFVIMGLGSNYINLSWTDNSTDESSFELWRKTGNGSYSLLLTLSANMTAYSDTGVVCDTVYSYLLIANRASDNYERTVSLTNVSTAPCPGIPLNFRTTAVSPTMVSLAWDDNSSDETNFSLERKSTGSWAVIASPAANATSFNDTTMECGQSYQYRIRSYWSSTNSYSLYSTEITVAVPSCPAVNAPTGLNQAATTLSSITLSWTDNASDETNYRLERSSDGGTNWTQIATISGTLYTHSGLNCESSAQYRVRAYRSMGNSYSEYSNVLTASTSGCPVTAPSNPLVTSSTFGLSLSWTDNATNESDFELQQNTAGNWQTIASLPSNSTSFNLTGLLCQTAYSYRLRAYKSSTATYSPWLNINGTTSGCPALQASVLSGTSTEISVSLNWTVDSTAQSFALSYFNGSQWTSLGTFNSGNMSYTHTSLGCGQAYQYRLLSQRSQDNASILSNTLSMSTLACAPLATPAAPVVVNSQASLVSLQIPAMPTGASSMSLERSQDGLSWINIGFVSTNYIDVNVSCGSSYQYRLVAYRASDGQFSPPSAVASTTTAACPVAVSMIIGVYHQGSWSFVDSNATSNPANTFNYGDASWQPLVGDWDGDGVDGIGLYRNGEFVLRSVVAGVVQESRFNFGEAAAYQAVAGDWNGDGVDTIGVFGNGQFILSDDNLNIHYRFNLGDNSAWIPVAGDWDGNGADGLALYKEGSWILVESAVNPVSQILSYGPAQAGWLPVVGDWNGDGRDTIGLYSNGLWRIRLESNTGGAEGSFLFGTAGNIPLSTFEGGIPSGEYSAEAFIIPTESPEPAPEATPEATAES